MRYRSIATILMFFLVISILGASAMTDDDVAILENASEAVMEDSGYISSADVEVSGNTFYVDFVPSNRSRMQILMSFGVITEVYAGAYTEYPEIVRMQGTIKNIIGEDLGTIHCFGSWVDDIDIDDQSEMNELILRVTGTFKEA